MIQRKFTIKDQNRFAQLSGDYNPIHLDVLMARRLMSGRPIVYGVYGVLWALDCWVREQKQNIVLRSINVKFFKAIGVGEEVSCYFLNLKKNKIEINLLVSEAIATQIYLEVDSKVEGSNEPEFFLNCYPERRECQELAIEGIEKAFGILKLCLHIDEAKALFPFLISSLPKQQLVQIMATSELVGMRCPGLRSMYSAMELLFQKESSDTSILTYKVTTFDYRFGLALLDIAANGMEGVIKTFLIPPPIKQAGYLEISEKVNSTEFSGQRALIVGGSRGLGELTAKILSAGGAKVKLTYHMGKEDAERVVAEISSESNKAVCFNYNVLRDVPDIDESMDKDWIPTHLYYFATPFIFSAVKESFSSELFSLFCDYYVRGFLNCFNSLKKIGTKYFFYPSSVAVNEQPTNMGEYVAAKIAGESLCAFLKKCNSEIIIYKPRLPRLATDQTVKLLPTKWEDSVVVIRKHLRDFKKISH